MDIHELERKKKSYEDEIKNIENEIKNIKKEAYLDPESIKIADIIHKYICKYDHNDQCGWYYENWEDPGYTRTKYLGVANELITAGYQVETIENIFKIIFKF